MVLGMRNCLLDVCSKTLPALSIALIIGCVLKNLSNNGKDDVLQCIWVKRHKEQ